jgi:arylsulfatase A-like enzyme
MFKPVPTTSKLGLGECGGGRLGSHGCHRTSGKVLLIILLIILIAAIIWIIVSLQQNPYSGKDLPGDLNIVLITLDTTRPDRLGCYGYRYAETSNIDRLSKQGIIFTQALTHIPITLPSHCSMMTGLDVLSHGIRDNGKFYLEKKFTTLAEILKKNGYKTAAVTASFVLDSRFGLDQGFEFYEDNLEKDLPRKGKTSDVRTWQGHRLRRFERPAGEVSDIAIEWLKNNYRDKFFLWVHFYDPHQTYNPPQEYKTRYENRRFGLYDGEIAYVDHELGKILNELKKHNLSDRTLIIVASDHGEVLGEHNGYNDHGLSVYEEELKAALIFVLPGVIPKAKVIKDMVSLSSITPTVLDILGIEERIRFAAESLYPLMIKNKKSGYKELYCETKMPKLRRRGDAVYGLRTNKHKIIFLPKQKKVLLYDLKKDPGEQNNLFNRKNRVHDILFRRLLAYIEKIEKRKFKPTMEMDEEARQKLKSLGYL